MPFNYRPWSLEVQKSTCQDLTKPGTLSTKVMEGVSKDGGIHSEVLRPNQEVGGMLASGRSLKLTAPIDTVGCKPWCVSLNAHVVWVRGIGSDLLSTVKDIDGFGCADGHVAWGARGKSPHRAWTNAPVGRVSLSNQERTPPVGYNLLHAPKILQFPLKSSRSRFIRSRNFRSMLHVEVSSQMLYNLLFVIT